METELSVSAKWTKYWEIVRLTGFQQRNQTKAFGMAHDIRYELHRKTRRMVFRVEEIRCAGSTFIDLNLASKHAVVEQ